MRRAGRDASVDVAQADAAFGSDALDLVRGLADHLTGDGGEGALRRLDASLARQEAAERTNARLAGATTALREGVPVLGLLAALWLVGSDVASGSTSPALLAASALGVLGAFEAVGGLGAAWGASEGLAAASRRVRALGEQPPAVQERPEPLLRPRSAALSFEGVTLTYPGAARPALVDLDLHVGDGPLAVGLGAAVAAGPRRLAGREPAARPARRQRGRAGRGAARRGSRERPRERRPARLGGRVRGAAVAGERARIGLARALLTDADVLLLDEPRRTSTRRWRPAS